MKKIVFCALMFAMHGQFAEEVLIVKPKVVKKESTAKVKEHLMTSLEELLFLATASVKQLTELIEQVVGDVKDLAGQKDGLLSSADKKTLLCYQEKVQEIQKLLQDLHQECCLSI